MEQPRITVQYKADQLEQTTWFFSQIYLPDNFTNIIEYFAKDFTTLQFHKYNGKCGLTAVHCDMVGTVFSSSKENRIQRFQSSISVAA